MTAIWTISLAGNAATRQQVRALAEAVAAELPGKNPGKNIVTESFFPKLPPDARVLSNTNFLTWTQSLSARELDALTFEGPGFSGGWPDIIVSCRPEVAAIALGIKRLTDGRTKIIHIQNPNDAAGAYAFDLSGFDVVIRQPHENLSGANVISSRMALHGMSPERAALSDASASLKQENVRLPLLGVLVGGSDENLLLGTEDFRKLGEDMRQAGIMPSGDGSVFVVTSRRTGAPGVGALKQAFAGAAHAFVDDPRLDYAGVLGTAERLIVTGDSLSMISEAVATAKPVSVHDFGGRLARHPLYPVVEGWAREGLIGLYPHWPARGFAAFNECRALAQQIVPRL